MLSKWVLIAMATLSVAAHAANTGIEIASCEPQLETKSSIDDLRSLIDDQAVLFAELKLTFAGLPKKNTHDYIETEGQIVETAALLQHVRDLLETNPSYARSASTYLVIQINRVERRVSQMGSKPGVIKNIPSSNDVEFWNSSSGFGGPKGLPPK